jgi:DNA repair protein RecO (recombination protein O)
MAYITPMQWADEGLVLGVRRHGETSAILELMTRGHGRHLGLVHGGRSRRMQPVLQPGNSVEAVWRARLDDQLGHFTVEPAVSRAARLISSPASLYALATLAAHLRLLPERDPHPGLIEARRRWPTTSTIRASRRLSSSGLRSRSSPSSASDLTSPAAPPRAGGTT